MHLITCQEIKVEQLNIDVRTIGERGIQLTLTKEYFEWHYNGAKRKENTQIPSTNAST
jgi:hypothetical protein